jgi:hypothetical protein
MILNSGGLSARDVEKLKHRLADRDTSVMPKLGPRASKDSAQWVQARDALINALNRWERDQW